MAKVREVNPDARQEDWIKLAAFIDGEGCISITKQTRSAFQGRWQHTLVLHIGNTDPRLALWITRTFGVGKVHLRPSTMENQKDFHYWQVTGRTAAAIIRGCYPYFILKREQADIAFSFTSLVRLGGHKNGLSQENYDARQGFHKSLSDLKNKIILISEVA